MGRTKRIGKAVQAGDIAETLLKRSDRRGGLAGARVCRAWEAVAGPAVAAHSTAVRVTEGELLVAVDSPAWASELSLMGAQFLAELQHRFGKDAVRAIRFSVSRAVHVRRGPDEKPAAEADVANRPTQEEIEAALSEVPPSVTDPVLRNAIARASAALQKTRSSRSDTSL
ncbi:MAG: DUF721 domain-containing protein [Anaerosomatales bacterium]|nr:DUF721 domain-containing protein [Anaerosomatales bacterium]